MQWSEAVKEEETKEERPLPSPRYSTASCIVDGKIYIFGGHQGYGDKRKSLKDFWSFDIANGVWQKIECKDGSCESRGGHSMFAVGARVYIYGGWNEDKHHKDIACFDVESNQWSNLAVEGGKARSNFCSVLVETLPSWKYFIFGGEEGESEKSVSFTNTTRVLDIDTMIWETVVIEESKESVNNIPSERELSSMVFHVETDRLIMFGGLSKEWNSDIHTLNVSSIAKFSDIYWEGKQKAKVQNTLNKLEEIYSAMEFEVSQHKDTDVHLLKMKDDDVEQLDDNIISVKDLFNWKFFSAFEDRCNYWKKSLYSVSEVYETLYWVQMQWLYLESYFSSSDEIRKKLPTEFEQFVELDTDLKSILADGKRMIKVLDFWNQDSIMSKLEKAKRSLDSCQKGLADLTDRERKSFPRFYFLSNDDLLDILSNGSDPMKIMSHIPQIFNAINTLAIEKDGETLTAVGFDSCTGKEEVKFDSPLDLVGDVGSYLSDVMDKVKTTLKTICNKSNKDILNMERRDWLLQDPAQITLLVSLIDFVHRVEQAMQNNDLNKCQEKQKEILRDLVKMIREDIEKPVRTKIINMITHETHSSDIVNALVSKGVKSPEEFEWQLQLRPYFIEDTNDCTFMMGDSRIDYGYEYLGNGPRLVLTPLTDRIYRTAVQALQLGMGCAPCGPAGTGKTETIKDLASALGKACYVFNCSDQFDYLMMAKVFKGLASSGSWGCFDEFNRVVPEVLSVCALQIKSILDAVKQGVKRFMIQDDEISLDSSCGIFITMNPGYWGRSELPKGLKELLRTVVVVVPDLWLICEIMLCAEGFDNARELSNKLVTLFRLCREHLSKQNHYDWGLRAIKSIIITAGWYRRADPDLDEEELFMRALRDYNLPKFISEDLQIFMGLVGDFFPSIDAPKKRDLEFEHHIEAAAETLRLWPDPEFIKKIVEFKELLEIRHGVFLLGPAGCGKSSIWKTLAEAQSISGSKTTYVDINPKSITPSELYGEFDTQNGEWRDGVLSKFMRSLGQESDIDNKWIILDDDVDALWIENMNSVLDDNKLLVLASGERIPLKPDMRMIFEIKDWKVISPATVSRVGILNIPDDDGYQWRAYVKSWIMSKTYSEDIKEQLQNLFDEYCPETLSYLKKNFKTIIPVVDIQMITATCKLLESILETQEVQELSKFFVFSCIWSIGAGFTEVDGKDFRKEFSNWWKDKWDTVKFPDKGGVFDYYVDIEDNQFKEWSKMIEEETKVNPNEPISSLIVQTSDTVSFQYLLSRYISVGHAPLLVGNAGCGKTQISKSLLKDLSVDPEAYTFQTINFNFYTDSTTLQNILEQRIEKKAGRTFGPQGKGKLIYFIDDLNLPRMDCYGTQNSISLLRQHADYGHWYDRTKLQLKDITQTLKYACMNPAVGTGSINPRLQRHFWLLAVPFPENSSLFSIYSTLLDAHFIEFNASIQDQVTPVIKATLALHGKVEENFRKTANAFHYEFNARHLTNVFQGLLVAQPEAIKDAGDFIKLWVHEAERVYGDRLVSKTHLNTFKDQLGALVNDSFSEFDLDKYFNKNPENIVFARFAHGFDKNLYDQFSTTDDLSCKLQEALIQYNDTHRCMDLVLFEDAVAHVCRISRIISSNGGHALLVGVGGSGKRSLSRLSSFICKYLTKGIKTSSVYEMHHLKTDLQLMYNDAGIKGQGVLFLLTEGQITNEKFLTYINDVLSSGEIADHYTTEEKDAIINAIKPAVQDAGIVDNKENCWNYFISRIRRNLHMSLCFSPVGESFKNTVTKFPTIINNTVIDWFHPWSEEALLSVSTKFTEELDLGTNEFRDSILNFMPYSFKVVTEASEKFYKKENRRVYTTPKSFLEFINQFKTMLRKNKGEMEANKQRYELGVMKLKEAFESVAKLEEDIKNHQTKESVKEEANKYSSKIELAHKLMSSLRSETERWEATISMLTNKLKAIIGDVSLSAAFVSYLGPFSKDFRDMIIQDKFVPFFHDSQIQISQDSNPVRILADEATIIEWNNWKLPADQVSIENGCILNNSERFPIIIDPQSQGITWIKEKEKNNGLKVGRLTDMKKLIQILEIAIEDGTPVIIEDMEDSTNPLLASVYKSVAIKKGRNACMQLGDKEIVLNPEFKLFIHTKNSNLQYSPEIQADYTLINFTLTEQGLEDQILALVVNKEQSDLIKQKDKLIQQQNKWKIKLQQLEDSSLHQLETAEGSILYDVTLIESLGSCQDISSQLFENSTAINSSKAHITKTCEAYRPVAKKGALILSLMNSLSKIHSFYKFSLDSFATTTNRILDTTGEEEDQEKRVEALGEAICHQVFASTRRGLFEKHKLMFATMLCLRVLEARGEITKTEINVFINREIPVNPREQPESLKFMPQSVWEAVLGLESLPILENLSTQMEEKPLEWRKWYHDEKTEELDLPESYQDATEFQKLLLLRAMRPDRLIEALPRFIGTKIGEKYINQAPFDISQAYDETSSKTPMFFVILPGSNTTLEIEKLGVAHDVTYSNGKLVQILMGQGQEKIALDELTKAAKNGGWIIIQNLHLMQRWSKDLEKQLKQVAGSEDLHENFRCFISSEPSSMPSMEIIPESILQNSIKIINETPSDLKSNLQRAYAHFTQEDIDNCPKPQEFKAILFGLCMFHSLVLGRSKFGTQGWSKNYNFTDNDLITWADVLKSYLAKYDTVPYSDLQYLYGEIMYGGHITDCWDRRTNITFVESVIEPGLFTGMQLTRAPGFKSPDPAKFDRDSYKNYIDECLPEETPQMFGLHPNAEIGYLRSTANVLLENLWDIQRSEYGEDGNVKIDFIKEIINKFLGQLPENFSMDEIKEKITEIDPYIIVSLQECERINALLSEIRKSLNDLEASLAVSHSGNQNLEELSLCLSLNKVPFSWERVSYKSNKNLSEWFTDLLLRVSQVRSWIEELKVPRSLWISGLFSPNSFLTAVKQATARKQNLPLDNIVLQTEVTNMFDVEEVTAPSENGMYIHGLFLEGAQWEKGTSTEQGYLTEMTPNILHPPLPVMNIIAVQMHERNTQGFYTCPVYYTSSRSLTFIFEAYLKMENEDDPESIWILAGVALVMSPE